MARQTLQSQQLGTPPSGPHNSKPERSRLTANAITGLKPGKTRYEVTDPGSTGLQLRVMPIGSKHWFFPYYWRNRRQRLARWPHACRARSSSATPNFQRPTASAVRPWRVRTSRHATSPGRATAATALPSCLESVSYTHLRHRGHGTNDVGTRGCERYRAQ